MPDSVIPVRALHLDLKGLPPTPERLLSLLPLVARAGYNAVVPEWEDTFPWTVDERFRAPWSYTPEQVQAFSERCKELGLEIIPLVQCLGHMETPLSLPGYEHLRELPHKSDVLNPLAAGARELVEAMVDDVLRLLPEVTYFHLGGDEAWSFGSHPDTAAFIAEHGKGALYLQHVDPLLDRLGARGIRPILWHDMMLSWDDEALRALAPKADLLFWGYAERCQTTQGHHAVRHARHLTEQGLRLWGGTAYKGANGHNSDLPEWNSRQENALGYAELAAEIHWVGVMVTAWSRYSTQDVQCEPIDGALDCLVNLGLILRDGSPPGRDACLAVLAETGELTRFETCYSALSALQAARDWAWTVLRHLREHLVVGQREPGRCGGGLLAGRLGELRRAVARAEQTGQAARAALSGLVAEQSLDHFLAERIEPLRDELAELEPRVAAIEPAAVAELG